jgi:hypothetical protein
VITMIVHEDHQFSGDDHRNSELDEAPIPDGSRNITLTRIAGRLHDGTRSLKQLTADLMEINQLRCVPPLPEREVRSIARSIHKRQPCSTAPDVGEHVHAALNQYESAVWAQPWKGMAGNTDRAVLLALVSHARTYGSMIPAGIRVSISFRQLALAAGCSFPTARKAAQRLRQSGWVAKDDQHRQPHHAGAFVLRMDSARFTHLSTDSVGGIGGKDLRVPALRWRGLGKKTEALIRVLLKMHGAATVNELAAALHDKRPWDLRRRQIAPLEAAGVVEMRGADLVELSTEWDNSLELERFARGELLAEKIDQKLYEIERMLYRQRMSWHDVNAAAGGAACAGVESEEEHEEAPAFESITEQSAVFDEARKRFGNE